MESSVVLPASGASNGFSSLSAPAALLCSTSAETSDQSSLDDVHSGGPRNTCSPTDRSVLLPADNRVDKTRTWNDDGRAARRSERQQAAWDQMNERMELRRRDWNAQVERMRADFFKLKPPTSLTAAGDSAIQSAGQSSAVITADRRQQRVIDVRPSWEPSTITRQQFQASFDLSEYLADEIRVQTDGDQLIVSARHERTNSDNHAKNTPSRQFTRQIEIPRYVDASRLRCTLTDGGILVVEADAVACTTSSLPVSRAHESVTDRRLALPPRSPTHSISTSTLQCTVPPVILQPDGSCVFRVSVSLGAEFSADELSVKTIDRRLIVTAQRDETGPGRRAACRQFHHEFELPACVDPVTVTAHVVDDGQLVVEAPITPHTTPAVTM